MEDRHGYSPHGSHKGIGVQVQGERRPDGETLPTSVRAPTERMLETLKDLERRDRQGEITMLLLELMGARFAAGS